MENSQMNTTRPIERQPERLTTFNQDFRTTVNDIVDEYDDTLEVGLTAQEDSSYPVITIHESVTVQQENLNKTTVKITPTNDSAKIDFQVETKNRETGNVTPDSNFSSVESALQRAINLLLDNHSNAS